MARSERGPRQTPRLWWSRGLLGMILAGAAVWLTATHAPGADVVLVPVDHEGLLREVARHRGKIVVLDCWSTSCPPCVKEFPGLVRLAAAHPDDVVCMSIALDYDGVGTPEQAAGPVRAFLAQAAAGDVVNMLATEEADAMYRKLDLAGVPAVYVWRPDGTLARRFDEDEAARTLGRPFTYADVTATVVELRAAAGR